MVLVDGLPVLYAERGGRTLISFTDVPGDLHEAGRALAEKVTGGAIGSLTVTRIDGTDALASSGLVVEALQANGFAMTPQGLRLRSVGGRRA